MREHTEERKKERKKLLVVKKERDRGHCRKTEREKELKTEREKKQKCEKKERERNASLFFGGWGCKVFPWTLCSYHKVPLPEGFIICCLFPNY